MYQVFIRASPQRVWEALTSAELTRRYFYGAEVRSSFRPGDPIVYSPGEDQAETHGGTVLEADPPRRLVHTFRFTAAGDPEAAGDGPTRVTWEIEPRADGVCRLTLVHDDFDSETKTFRNVGNGWPFIVSSLKSLLETGEPLAVG